MIHQIIFIIGLIAIVINLYVKLVRRRKEEELQVAALRERKIHKISVKEKKRVVTSLMDSFAQCSSLTSIPKIDTSGIEEFKFY